MTDELTEARYMQYHLARDLASRQSQLGAWNASAPNLAANALVNEMANVTIHEEFDMSKLEEWTQQDLMQADVAYQEWLAKKAQQARAQRASSSRPDSAASHSTSLGYGVLSGEGPSRGVTPASRTTSRMSQTRRPIPQPDPEVKRKALAAWAYKKRVEAMEQAQVEATRRAQEQYASIVEQERKQSEMMRAQEAFREWRQEKAEASALAERERERRRFEADRTKAAREVAKAEAYAKWKAGVSASHGVARASRPRVNWYCRVCTHTSGRASSRAHPGSTPTIQRLCISCQECP
jgi:hypothetical protein